MGLEMPVDNKPSRQQAPKRALSKLTKETVQNPASEKIVCKTATLSEVSEGERDTFNRRCSPYTHALRVADPIQMLRTAASNDFRIRCADISPV